MDGQHEQPIKPVTLLSEDNPEASVQKKDISNPKNTDDQVKENDGELDYDVIEYKAIPEGEIFDPSAEIKKIRQLPKNERAKAIVEFKDKFIYQQEGFAFLRNELIQELKHNPAVTQTELYSIADMYVKRYGFPESSADTLIQHIDELYKRKTHVEQIRKDIPDDSLLCKQMFGFYPESAITVTTGPVTINVQFHNKTDFARRRRKRAHRSN